MVDAPRSSSGAAGLARRSSCELCGAALAAEHAHCSSRPARQLCCCCDACAILFSGRQGGRYRRVPRRRPSPAGLPPDRRSNGRACTCRSTWPSSSQQLRPGESSPSIPSPAGHRIAPDAGGLAGPGRREPDPHASSSPTSKHCWSTGWARRASITACRSTSATSWSA